MTIDTSPVCHCHEDGFDELAPIAGGEAYPARADTRLHLSEPDYSRPRLELGEEQEGRLLRHLARLYGEEAAGAVFRELERLLRVLHAHKPETLLEAERDFDPAERFSEKDVILITYGDLVHNPRKPPLQALAGFLDRFLRGAVNTVHILPFFPYSSDRGFAVVDYEQVDPALGTWEDIHRLGADYRLMFDGVINHVSAESRWFREFRAGNPDYRDHFMAFSTREAVSEEHLRLIMRPRASDLLTPFQTLEGTRYVWTTFGPDQVDLDYGNPDVLLDVIDVLLDYVRHGADILRLDAITYVWAELGTRCAYLEESHVIVKLLRAILDAVAPRVALVTETNIPHEENVRYFGDGADEAQMVYNFALPALVLHTFHAGDSRRLTDWAGTLEPASESATYLNFLDSHDGIPLVPVRGILDQDEVGSMIERVQEHGGLVSYRRDPQGQDSPYELNATWYDALNPPDSGESVDLQVDRYIASRSIALVLRGVPGVYLPGLVGSKNDLEAVLDDGVTRSINRRTICEVCLFRRCSDPDSSSYKVAHRFGELLERRIETPAFHPNGAQRILRGSDGVLRRRPGPPRRRPSRAGVDERHGRPAGVHRLRRRPRQRVADLDGSPLGENRRAERRGRVDDARPVRGGVAAAVRLRP